MFNAIGSFFSNVAKAITGAVSGTYRYITSLFSSEASDETKETTTRSKSRAYRKVSTGPTVNDEHIGLKQIETFNFMDGEQAGAFRDLKLAFDKVIHYPYEVVVNGTAMFIKDNRTPEYYRTYRIPEFDEINRILEGTY